MSHTPGPWQWGVINNNYGVELGPRYAINVKSGEDAALIAAAPEMLAALIAMDEYCHNPKDTIADNSAAKRERIWKQVRAAIAKAEGK